MDNSTPTEILRMGEDLTKEVSEVKHCQDALIKALQWKKEDILACGWDDMSWWNVMHLKKSQSDIHQLANIVKKETLGTDFEPTIDDKASSDKDD